MGYRPTTEYCFGEEQSDAIIRTAAYHRRDFCLSVIWFPPREHVNIRPSIATPFRPTPRYALGSLDRLPLELLHDSLFRLDMYSLFKFRQTNLRSRQIVDSLKQYQMVVLHGLNLFCALLRTRLATDISVFEFYDALCTKGCTLCDEFGGFMSLLTWERCCFKCLQGAPEIQIQSLATVRRKFHPSKTQLNQLKSFKTLPGIYSMEESVRKSRAAIVSARQAISMFKHESYVLSQAQLAILDRNQKLSFMGSCSLPYYDRLTGQVDHGVSCAGCQLAFEKNIVDTRAEGWLSRVRDKLYSRDGFLEHFRWCEQAQLLWRSSDEGSKRPIELPEVVRRGGYFAERE